MNDTKTEPLSAALRREIESLQGSPDELIDLSDIPEAADWSGAVRGKFYRPVKQLLSLRLDADVIAWFKASGEGYQTRINAALRDHVDKHGARSR